MEGRKGHLHHPSDPPPGLGLLVERRRAGLVQGPGLPSQALAASVHPLEICLDPFSEQPSLALSQRETLRLPWGKSQEGGFATSSAGDSWRTRATVRRETWRAWAMALRLWPSDRRLATWSRWNTRWGRPIGLPERVPWARARRSPA